jgi:hypothetical protein
LNISLHFVSSKPKAKMFSHFFWPFDTMLFLISNKYISLVPHLLFKMVLTNEGINGVFVLLMILCQKMENFSPLIN